MSPQIAIVSPSAAAVAPEKTANSLEGFKQMIGTRLGEMAGIYFDVLLGQFEVVSVNGSFLPLKNSGPKSEHRASLRFRSTVNADLSGHLEFRFGGDQLALVTEFLEDLYWATFRGGSVQLASYELTREGDRTRCLGSGPKIIPLANGNFPRDVSWKPRNGCDEPRWRASEGGDVLPWGT